MHIDLDFTLYGGNKGDWDLIFLIVLSYEMLEDKVLFLHSHAKVDARLTNFDREHWAACHTHGPCLGCVLKAYNLVL